MKPKSKNLRNVHGNLRKASGNSEKNPDLAILHLVKELSEIAKAAQHVEKLGNKAE